MSAVPVEVVVAKTSVEEPLVVHVVNVPISVWPSGLRRWLP